MNDIIVIIIVVVVVEPAVVTVVAAVVLVVVATWCDRYSVVIVVEVQKALTQVSYVVPNLMVGQNSYHCGCF